ncbi:MAG: hypothetical protein HYS25_15225 [Ignavibacteriales bacterium]|nr:hypothetical protein [Ignavibacteriales bacterium]
MHKKILSAAAIIILLINPSAYNFQQQKKDTLKHKNNAAYDLQLEMYDIYKTRQADIVMLGNSLTAGANWSELLGRHNIVGRGIPGDVLTGYLARIDYVFMLKPKIVFILGGLNDIYAWTPIEEIYASYIKLVEELKAQNIIPVIQSTTYASKDYAKEWGGTPEINLGRNKEVDKLNKLLFDYASRNNIDYIDINSKTAARDNYLRPELTWDGVHLKAEGYKIWAREIEKILKKYKL